MKYCRFESNNSAQYGLVESSNGVDYITRLLMMAPERAEDVEDLPSKPITQTPLSQAKLLYPVTPSKIICVGRNYREHAAEFGNEVRVGEEAYVEDEVGIVGNAVAEAEADR